MSTQRSGLGPWTAFVLAAVAIAAGSIIATGQITVPNTFVNHTTADAPQVNANFNALASNALNRTGGTMTGTLNARDVIPTADTTYDAGSASFAFRDLYVKRNAILNGQTYGWPSGHGASGTVLTENGTGTLTWSAPVVLSQCGLRATLTSGLPVTVTDVTAATTVYVTPVQGGQCAFYDGSATWAMLTNAEVGVSVPATTSTPFDVFCYNNAGAMACEALSWTNDTTRATALALQNNVWVKSGATTRRYIATGRTTTVSGQTEDSGFTCTTTKRYLWNNYNRVRRPLCRKETTASWPYSIATIREANGSPANQVEVVVGVADTTITLTLPILASNDTGGAFAGVGIGEDSTSTFATESIGGQIGFTSATTETATATFTKMPAVGRHVYSWNEESQATGVTTWRGTPGSANAGTANGLSGWIEG